MLKRGFVIMAASVTGQPPSGGCVLKLGLHNSLTLLYIQPPSGGCVLKQIFILFFRDGYFQPPSGGCVLKPVMTGETAEK